ncbi:hypothetical protein VHEMI01386 [[Torrubiella] hemipterigena]|uniref:Protein kinase domain-containing protein n=1 Tax=[Torrubiella] hemipterigena TaxID=1531966 RepID=A0A0A1SSZ2_9HYPO|nr:hypothetical protein VHEMI01386 [[Torrubiella] hemipterigena]
MATDSYSSVCADVYRAISAKLERKNDDARRFAPRGTIRGLFQKNNHALLRRIFKTLSAEFDSDDPLTIADEDIDTYIERVETRKLSTLIGTVIFTACSAGATRAVVRHFIVPKILTAAEARHGQLPLSQSLLRRLFQDTNDIDRFANQQTCFCPVIIYEGEANRYDLQDGRLPYISEEIQGEGSFGKVFRIEVAKNHFRSRKGTSRVPPQVMARKDYDKSDLGPKPEVEFNIMKQIIESPLKHDNVLQSLGFLQIGTMYSLFMPLASFDLLSYMNNHPNAPKQISAKMDFLESAAGLAKGLNHLHTGIETRDGKTMVCYHMDLNPSNILLFPEGHRWIWKISDFGMSKIKTLSHNNTDSSPRDFNSFFKRRRPVNPSPPPTANRRGDGTYLAPEATFTNPSMKAGSDVWALGCVISVLLTYMDGGQDAILKYENARLKPPRAARFDRFFFAGQQFSSPTINSEVISWHRQLEVNAQRRSSVERNVVRTLRKFLEEKVLLMNIGDRCSAGDIAKYLETAKEELQTADAPHGNIPPRSEPIERISRLFDGVSDRVRSRSRNNLVKVEQTRPTSLPSSDFKGCAFAPDGSFLVYWTDSELTLYTEASLSFTPGAQLRDPGTWCPDDHSRSNGEHLTLKHVCITDRYLIASIVGRSYVYIFNIPDGRWSSDALQCFSRLPIDFPGADAVAISPNNQTFVFVARNRTSINGNATLVYLQMPDVLEFLNPPESDGPPRIPILRPVEVDLSWPASEVSELSVLDTKDVYFVVKQRLTLRSRNLVAPVVHVSLNQTRNPPVANIFTLKMDPQGFDVSTTAGFFSTFCLLKNSKLNCAVVTRTKKLHIESFSTDSNAHKSEWDILDYRITKLVCSGQDRTLLALGYKSSDRKMMLIRMQIRSKLSVTALCVLPGLIMGDEVSVIKESMEDMDKVLITSFTGASRATVYKVEVPHSS